ELTFLAGGGEMGQRIRAYDWSKHQLGEPETWPPGLRGTLRLMLNASHAMHLWWGPDLFCFENDGFRDTLGWGRDPLSLGQLGRQVWWDHWDAVGPPIERIMSGGEPSWRVDSPIPAPRRGLEETRWTYGFSPVDDEHAANG